MLIKIHIFPSKKNRHAGFDKPENLILLVYIFDQNFSIKEKW